MILVRTPLRISFAGGGTDLPGFYTIAGGGAVISATIDQYFYIFINKPFNDKIYLKYSLNETVSMPEELQHTRVRAALIHTGITKQIEIASLSDVASRAGLGGSSSFMVGLLHGLYSLTKKQFTAKDLAEDAAHIEIGMLEEPIGKQDQYAAAFGGLNVFFFDERGRVVKDSVYLEPDIQRNFQNHLLLLFTGTQRDASTVLKDQTAHIQEHYGKYVDMAQLVPKFRQAVEDGNFKEAGAILQQQWDIKKTLSERISSPFLDESIHVGIANGAYGGKVMGAGGGGCVLFIAPPETHEKIENALLGRASSKKIPIKFTQAGSEIIATDHINYATIHRGVYA